MDLIHGNASYRRLKAALALALAATSLAGCDAMTRLSQIGATPPLTTIQNPKTQPGYQPVSMPMPQPLVAQRRPNSLWRAGSRAFFKDQRASQVGDILTIDVSFDDKADFSNETQTQRTTAEHDGVSSLFGLSNLINHLGPATNNIANINGTTNNDGKAAITREEQVTLEVAAMVMQVLPNGNLVVQGHQEIRVNNEVRDLQIGGVLRQQDISATNTTTLDKLAEARVSYGGRGQMTNDQQPRYGEQLLDIVSPF
ncbi:MAG TPA: flagellar basal body L-ring protein FlgH [Stellaceae bacterium]|nr:flagellar basal body L-ring protein FlgH [Stellaceae bacterium]